eukprot:6773136-Pyramimonas_sp.AAC.1
MGLRNAILGGGRRMHAVPLGSFCGAPYGAWVWRTHVATPTGPLGGAPYGATKHCTGCGGRTWPPPLGPWVELP